MDRTPWNPEWSNAVAKVKSLVESVFSCRVHFQTVDSFLSANEGAPSFLKQDLVFLESTLFEIPSLIRGTRPGLFAFPLKIRRAGRPSFESSLVGIAVIEGLAASDDQRLQQLGEFLQLAMESRLEAFERLLDIEQREQALRDDSKVVHIFSRRDGAESRVELFHLRNYDESLQLEKPMLILNHPGDASQEFASNRLALEIFNKTSLWFFVNIHDLSDDAFQSVQAFRDLGRMCIFIPDLSLVSIERQLRLAEVFEQSFHESADNGDIPRVIAAIHKFPAQLLSEGTVLPHLLPLMMNIELELGSTVRQAVRQIESAIQNDSGVPRAPLVPATKASNLIPLLGRWRADDGSNPTFH